MRFLAFIILSFILNPAFLGADEAYRFVVKEKPERMGNKFLYFEDPSNKITIDNVLEKGIFKPNLTEVPSYNITTSVIWAKIKLLGDPKVDWFLCLDPAAYNKITFYKKKTRDSKWEEALMGDALPNEYRKFPTSHFLFKLDLSDVDTTLLVIRFRDHFPITIDAKIGPLEQFIGPFHNIDLYNGVCFGIMIMMMIYNLYLFITNRQLIYVYYVLYVLFSIFFTGYLGGYGLHMPVWIRPIMIFAPIIPPAAFGIFGMLFTLELFKNDLSARFKIIVKIFMCIAIGNTILSMTKYKELSEIIIQPLGLFLGIISINSGVTALKKKNTAAKFYLLGFGAYMGSLFYLILSAQGVFPINSFTWQCLITGSMIESIFLSFALGDKFKMAQMENERLIREQNTMLERKVKERTIELEQQKELVEEKNKAIVDSINYAQRIQDALITSEMYIEKTLNRLNKN